MTETISFSGKSICFSDINGAPFHYVFSLAPSGPRPFLRLLALHTKSALQKAKAMGWTPDESDYIARQQRNLDLARLSLEPHSSVVLRAFFRDNA